jgi:SAM-dependent methyltransferase
MMKKPATTSRTISQNPDGLSEVLSDLQPDDDPYARIASFYDRLMATVPYGSWMDYIEQVMEVSQFKPARILDVACGTGTVALMLARRGYQVAGIDKSEAMLEVARKKAAKRGLDIPFLCQDAAQLKLKTKEKFDLALCLYDSLNYILDNEGLLAAFRAIRRTLRPEGMFFFDLNSLHSFQGELFTQRSSHNAKVRYAWVSKFDPYSRLARIAMHFAPTGGKPFNIVHCQRAHLVEEVVGLLRKARFRLVQMYDAYSLLPAGSASERIFYLAQKPAKR